MPSGPAKAPKTFDGNRRSRPGLWGLGRGMSFHRICGPLNFDVAGCEDQHMRAIGSSGGRRLGEYALRAPHQLRKTPTIGAQIAHRSSERTVMWRVPGRIPNKEK